jgi:hypothetical protein
MEEKMISMLATNSLTEAPAFISWAKVIPQLGTVALISDAPWLYSALTQVREIESAGQVIRGMGDFQVAVQTAMSARKVLSGIRIQGLPAPSVAPVSGGGLSVTWTLGAKEVKLSFAPGGEAVYFRVVDDEVVDEVPVVFEVPSPVARHLKWMLEPGV